MEIRVENAGAALQLCREMLGSGDAQIFRGQTHDWPRLIPGIFRLDGANRDQANEELSAFGKWAAGVPQMAAYWNILGAPTAIAQHYGIATNLLDLTDDPEIAILFSKSTGDPDNSESVLYCFKEDELSKQPDARLVRINVHNLWRLEAQRGLFLEFLDESLGDRLRERATRIYFPSEPLSAAERTRLYPTRKSALEIVLDQWFYRRKVEQLLSSLTSDGGIKHSFAVRRHTYPGVFKWRQEPDLNAGWIRGEPRWVFPVVESVAIANDPTVIHIPLPSFSSPAETLFQITETLGKEIKERGFEGQLVSFAVKLPPEKDHLAGSIEALINRCWDGIRQLPYYREDQIYCLALTVTLLLARTMEVRSIDDWPVQLFGEVELLEVAPIGGHIEAGYVSRADLVSAFSQQYHNRLTAYMLRKSLAEPLFLMNYVVDHFILFDFERFQRIFVRQLIPTMLDGYWREDLNLYDGALGCLWSINFNPALVGYVTHSSYRFSSPLAMEKDSSRLIYIHRDMDQHDIEEAFVSCMPWILGGGKPYQVLFHGYGKDPRAIWKIRGAIQLAKWICAVGGISVLEVMPSVKGLQEPRETVGFPTGNGMGAFEIWLTAKEKVQKINGKSFDAEHPLFKKFWGELMVANAKIDQLAQSKLDWPGPIAAED